MKSDMQDHHNHGFLLGLVTGTAVGACLALWLAPRAGAEVRQRVEQSAKELRERASKGYEEASHRVEEVVEGITKKGQRVRNDVADAVARSAHEVERRAKAAKKDGAVTAATHE